TLAANFSVIVSTYTITTSSSPASGGTTTGPAAAVSSGSSVTVTATPAFCYRFVNWTEGASVVSTSAAYTFTASANRSLVANFAQITYAVSGSSSPSAGGSVTGGGTVNCGSSVTLTASTSTGYNFSNWTENGTAVSTSASYTFAVNGNR